jgi:hypothetical protein
MVRLVYRRSSRPIGIQKLDKSKCNLRSFDDNKLQLGGGMGNTPKYLSSKGRDKISTIARVPCQNGTAYRNGQVPPIHKDSVSEGGSY